MLEQVLSIIKDLGFPIAVCLFLAYYIKTMTEQFRADIKEITNRYEAAVDKHTKSLDKVFKVLTSLEATLGAKESDDND